MTNQVVITGVGCVSPFGAGLDALWQGLFSGRTPQPPTCFDGTGFRTAGVYEVPDDGQDAGTRPVRLARAAAEQALQEAGLTRTQVSSAGLALASTSAGWHLPGQSLGGEPVHMTEVLRKEWPAVVLASELGLRGPSAVLSSACAASTGAVSWAVERIRSGESSVMLVGAVDVITEVVLAGFNSMRLLTQHRTRPFAEDRDGFILAEGAAFMVMEEAGHAAARSALARARVLGWGASSDSTHLTTPDPVGIARSLRAALADAGRSPGQISVFYAHGTASAVNDRAESDAVLDVFVQESAPVTTAAIKSALGHAEGAAGMFAIVAAVEGLNRGKVPPVLGVERPDPATAHLMLADHQTSHPHGDVMVHASGFGGTNCTVLLGPAPSQGRDAPVGHRVPTRTRPPGIPVAVAAATATEAEAVARGFHPEWSPEGGPVPATPPRSPRPDQSCLLLSAAVAALLGGLPMTERHKMLRGGLLTGTEHGGQRHHARMHAGLRKRGARGVDPLDFALSTYNAPAAMTSIMLGFHGQTEAFLGATAGVEALVTGAWLIASGRVGGIVCAGWDAPENRLWAAPGAPSVPARATALALCPVGTDWEGAGVSLAGIAGVRRLSFAAHPASPEAFEEIAGQFNPGEPDMLVATGLAGQEADTLSGAGWTVLPPEGGAAAPLGAHVATIERIAAGQARDAIVVSTAASGATIAVHYTVIAAGRYE